MASLISLNNRVESQLIWYQAVKEGENLLL